MTVKVLACQFSLKDDLVFIHMPVTQTNLTAELLKEQLQQAGYGRCLLLQDQIKNLLLEYQQVQQKIKQQLQAEGYALLQAKADATLLWIKAQEDAGLDVVRARGAIGRRRALVEDPHGAALGLLQGAVEGVVVGPEVEDLPLHRRQVDLRGDGRVATAHGRGSFVGAAGLRRGAR